MTEYLDDKIERIQNLVISVGKLEGNTVQDFAETIRGLEGTAGRLYFETINYVLPLSYQFNGRSSRPAKDSFNAFLNYAYGILYTRIEKSFNFSRIRPLRRLFTPRRL
jgi:CRISPR-associated protein Cas1